jgi:hypothetical protein
LLTRVDADADTEGFPKGLVAKGSSSPPSFTVENTSPFGLPGHRGVAKQELRHYVKEDYWN